MAEKPPETAPPERVLLGILALLAAERDERVEGVTPRRTELILTDAGFSAREIAQLTGKEYEAVRSSVRRTAEAAKKRAAEASKKIAGKKRSNGQ
jgi:DNA-directed RNA polymerase specialized sigma24 family protein